MIARPEDYRASAAECERQARGAQDAKIKAQFLELARQWRLLADQADRMLR